MYKYKVEIQRYTNILFCIFAAALPEKIRGLIQYKNVSIVEEVIFNAILVIDGWVMAYEIVLRIISVDLANNYTIWIQVIAYIAICCYWANMCDGQGIGYTPKNMFRVIHTVWPHYVFLWSGSKYSAHTFHHMIAQWSDLAACW